MKAEELRRRLEEGEVVAMTASAWEKLAGDFELVETRDTMMAGEMEVRRLGRRWLVVEQSDPARRALRSLPTKAAVRTFVQERMAAYDRMWDG